MNKTELIVKVAKDAGITKKEAGMALDSILTTIEDTVASGNSVMFLGFGTFESKDYAARSGINPATRQPMTIPAKRLPKFKPHTAFKEKVNK